MYSPKDHTNGRAERKSLGLPKPVEPEYSFWSSSVLRWLRIPVTLQTVRDWWPTRRMTKYIYVTVCGHDTFLLFFKSRDADLNTSCVSQFKKKMQGNSQEKNFSELNLNLTNMKYVAYIRGYIDQTNCTTNSCGANFKNCYENRYSECELKEHQCFSHWSSAVQDEWRIGWKENKNWLKIFHWSRLWCCLSNGFSTLLLN